MKKNVKLAILISSLLLTTGVNAQAVKTSATGAAYTTITNASGDSQTVLSIGPRLAIQSPWWINNMVNAAKDDVQQANKTKDVAKTEKPELIAAPVPEKKVEQPVVNPVNNVAVNATQPKVIKNTKQQIPKVLVVKTNDIAGFNTTSLDEMTKLGQQQTEQAYLSHIK